MNQLEEMRAHLPEATENGVALVALPDLAALLAVAEAAERYVAEELPSDRVHAVFDDGLCTECGITWPCAAAKLRAALAPLTEEENRG